MIFVGLLFLLALGAGKIAGRFIETMLGAFMVLLMACAFVRYVLPVMIVFVIIVFIWSAIKQ